MAIDFEKIKQKVAQLSGQGRKNNLWWPEIGKDYVIRVLPWPDGNDGQLVKERSFYHIGNGKALLAPSQFGKPDPIQTMITSLRNDGTPQSMEAAKKLYPKRKYYAPIIVRGEEEMGPRFWSLNRESLTDVLNLVLGEAGDITDIKEGRDLVIKCTPSGKKFNNRDVAKIGIQPKMTQTPAGTAKQIKEWNAAMPNLDDIYKLSPVDEIEKRLNDHFNADEQEASDGTEHSAAGTNGSGGKQRSHDVSPEASAELEDVFSKLDSLADTEA